MSGKKDVQQNMDKKKSNDPFACREPGRRLAPKEPGELPESYGENRVVVMPVDPDTVHVYWEWSNDHSSVFSDDQNRRELQSDVAAPERMLLRIEATATDAAGLHHEFIVEPGTGSNYLSLPSSVKICRAAIGKEAEESPFGSVVSSGNISLPPSPSDLRCKVQAPSIPHVPQPVLFLQQDAKKRPGGGKPVRPNEHKDIFQKLGSLLQVPIDAIPLENKAPSLANGKQDGPGKNVAPDLTEQCERKFVSGISSRGI